MKETELKQIDEITKVLATVKPIDFPFGIRKQGRHIYSLKKFAETIYNAGYRKQNDEELIDKIATYFEKEDNWTKLKYSWNICGKSVQLRDMLRDAICGAKMKGGAE